MYYPESLTWRSITVESAFQAAIRGHGAPEVGGLLATQSLAVVLAGVHSVKEGRTVSVAEMMAESG